MTRIAYTAQCAFLRSRAERPRASTGLLVVLLVALSLALSSSRVHAQDAGAPEPNQLTPPKLLAFVDAGYPDAARAEQREGAVLLALTIGDDGFVEDAVVLEPAGYGFDELAQTAARRFVFEPATRAGQPTRARIQYRYEFHYTPPPPPPPPVEARLTLTLRSAQNDAPIAGAELIITMPGDPDFALRLVSDAAGHVDAANLRDGSYQLAVAHPRFAAERHAEQLVAGQTTELTYRLSPARSYEEYGATARAKAPPREVTRRTIEREELTRVAGTRGDALRTIELLPGVARPPFGTGQVLIRGSAPADTQVLLDGIPVPLLYHFGGLTSFINSRALERIDFYPGNFSARYGRHTGGVIDVGVRDSATNGYHGVVDVNLPLDSSFLVEGPMGDKASFMVGARRSYFGEVLKAVVPKDSVGALAAPVYYDYQAFVNYKPTDRDRLRIGAYGASDRFDVLFAPDDADPSVQGLELGQQFHRVHFGWRRQYSQKLEHDMQVSYAREHNVIKVPPDFNLDLVLNTVYARAEWRYRMNKAVQLIVGTDSNAGNFDASYLGPSLPDGERADQGGQSFGALPILRYSNKAAAYQLAGYTEVALTPTRWLRVVPGLRLDYDSLIRRFAFDPRIAGIVTVHEGWRIKAGVGVFSQPPDAPQQLRGFGNPNLAFIKAIHYSVGVEHDFTDDLSLNIEGFFKNIYRRVVATDVQARALRGEIDPPPFDNDGIGRIYGLEVAGRKSAKGRWFGFLSYTLMRSERKDHDEPWRLFNYDQTHIFSAAGTVKLGRGWEMGGVIRIVTGNPYTPIVGSSYNQDVGSYSPVYGAFNSRRAPTFNRFDWRTEKTWRFDSWRLALYLDVQNAYNAKNREGVTYSFDYKRESAIRGIPIIPVLGVRGEF